MQLTRLAVFHPVIALTITMAVVIFGLAAFAGLGLEQNPQVDLPFVTVTARSSWLPARARVAVIKVTVRRRNRRAARRYWAGM